jgi:hypothetical protein
MKEEEVLLKEDGELLLLEPSKKLSKEGNNYQTKFFNA